MRLSIEQRLVFIEFRLFWEGQINRSDLVREFGISIPQASADLQRYAALAGPNLIYDASAKAYVAGPEFKPRLLKPSARRYLAYLRGMADDVFHPGETWIGRVPEFGVVPLVRRRLDPERLRKIIQAIRTKASLHIEYQSMTRPEPSWRWISLHALGFDGFRWHARAWCHQNGDFRDFVLARMLADGEMRPSEINSTFDHEWHRSVTLRVAPHPGLSSQARRIIELDYGMQDGLLEIRSRISLSFYLIRNLRLDLDATLFDPKQQQIVLLNREEVEKAQKQFRPEQSEQRVAAGD